MQKFTKLFFLAIIMLIITGSDSYSQSNRAWWDGLSPEWKEFFMSKYMKKQQIDAGVKMADSKIETLVGWDVMDLSGNQKIKDLKPLSQFKNLEILDISGTNIENLDGLKNVPNIKELNCSNSQLIQDLTPLKNMRRLEKLNCYNTSVANLNPIKYLSLKSLNVALCFISDNSLKAIEGMISLEKLDISENGLIRNLGSMHKLENLSDLNCSKSPVVSVDSIAVLQNLEYLDISNTNIRGIKPLVEVKTLLSIDISDTEIKNIDALYASTGIRNVKAFNLKIEDRSYQDRLKASVRTFNEKRPNCIIEYSIKKKK